jgi:hypothetical protein
MTMDYLNNNAVILSEAIAESKDRATRVVSGVPRSRFLAPLGMTF